MKLKELKSILNGPQIKKIPTIIDAVNTDKLNLLNGFCYCIYLSLTKIKNKIPQLKVADIELAKANPA